MKTTMKTWLVVLLTDSRGPVYLGEIDRGIRQGVRQIENAIRFTPVGARRVAAGYTAPKAVAIDVNAS
jgi:hypothetical protein